MPRQILQNEKGAVSMITVIFVTIILTVLTTSLIRLTVNEQREATDDDLTTRAYYAAESGVQDAITALKTGNVAAANVDECTPNTGDGTLSDSSNLDTAYTCQTIDETPSSYQAYLEEGEAIFFKLEAQSSNITSINVSWHINAPTDNDGDGDVTQIALRGDTDLPQKSAWSNGGLPYPAMLKVQLIDVPQGAVNRSDVENNIGFLNPSSSGSATIPTPNSLGVVGTGLRNASCSLSVAGGDYVCSVDINNVQDVTRDYFIRVQSIYAPTHIKIEALAGGTAVNLLNAQAVIDVTGRAGDVFRRVEERVSLVPDSLWPNYAILSVEDLCKNFVITDEASDPTNTKPDFAEVNPNIIGSCSY